MANQKRIWWGVQAVGIKPDGNTNAYTVIHGVQSVGLTTSVDIRRIFQLGQSDTYENVEEIPDVEVTVEKVFDGYPIVFHLSTQGASSASLIGRSNQRSIMALSLFDDELDSASGTPLATVEMSGLYLSSWGFEATTDGDITESTTLVGNNKIWKAGGQTSYGDAFDGTLFDNTDVPLAISGSGGVQQRENIVFEGSDLTAMTILPTDIKGISSSGTNDQTGGFHDVPVQRISISADLGRESILELGKRSPYCRYMTLPVLVSTDVEVMNLSGDWIDVTEGGNNTSDQTIRVVLTEGTNIYLGTKNRLTSITQGGGDTGGGNSTLTYSYENANQLLITHPQNPST